MFLWVSPNNITIWSLEIIWTLLSNVSKNGPPSHRRRCRGWPPSRRRRAVAACPDGSAQNMLGKKKLQRAVLENKLQTKKCGVSRLKVSLNIYFYQKNLQVPNPHLSFCVCPTEGAVFWPKFWACLQMVMDPFRHPKGTGWKNIDIT